MKFYIAGSSQDDANKIADLIEVSGHEITSRWLRKPFNRTRDHTVGERMVIASENHEDVTSADILILIASSKLVPGGKFVEAGIAIGQSKPVYVVGHRENMLMWHPSVQQFDSVEDLAKAVLALAKSNRHWPDSPHENHELFPFEYQPEQMRLNL